MSSSPSSLSAASCSHTQSHLEVRPSCWSEGSDVCLLLCVHLTGWTSSQVNASRTKLMWAPQNYFASFCCFYKCTSTSEPLHLLVSPTRTLSPWARSTWAVLWSPSALCLDLTFPVRSLSTLTAYHHLLALACSMSFPLPRFLFSKAFFTVSREEEQRVLFDSGNAARQAFTLRKTKGNK